MNVHVKTGDTVVILSGKDKGKKGKVLAVSPKEGKVIVEGCNMIKKHVKPRRMGEQGGIVDAEGAMYASKVMLVCPKCGKPTRIAHKILADGTKARLCKNSDCGETFSLGGENMAKLKETYVKDIAPALYKKFGYKSVMQIPKLDKVVVNVGCGEARDNHKIIDAIMADLATITGQKAVPCAAKKSVANFKLREGMIIGAKVTLRGDRMYEFVDRLFNVALPRVRDFRGINPNAFDGRGNYSLGLKEQLIFPEIEYDKIDKVRGMDIAFVTTAKTDEESRELLTLMGAPFAK